VGIALALAETGAPERAHELATLALEHEATWKETLVLAEGVLDTTRRLLSPEAAHEASRRGRALSWESAADQLLGA